MAGHKGEFGFIMYTIKFDVYNFGKSFPLHKKSTVSLFLAASEVKKHPNSPLQDIAILCPILATLISLTEISISACPERYCSALKT